MEDFSRLHFADAEVVSLLAESRDLQVVYRDWQKKTFTLTFTEVLGFEAFGVEGEDLSHGTESVEDPFLHRVGQHSRDSVVGSRCYVLWSASSDLPILRVVAKDFTVESWLEATGAARQG